MVRKYRASKSVQFGKDLKKAVRRGYDMSLLYAVIDLLETGNPLPPKYRDHALKGDWKGFRECHVAPDWLLVYRIEAGTLILVLQRTGTHSDLF